MSGRSAAERFDVDRFVEDFEAYLDRHQITRAYVAAALDFGESTLQMAVTRRSLTLRSVLAIADIADLSIDAYRLPSEFIVTPVPRVNGAVRG